MDVGIIWSRSFWGGSPRTSRSSDDLTVQTGSAASFHGHGHDSRPQRRCRARSLPLAARRAIPSGTMAVHTFQPTAAGPTSTPQFFTSAVYAA